MQNKPNLRDTQMNVSSILTKYYERNDIFAVPENKANSNPIKANLLDAQINVSAVLTKDYDNEQRTMNNERLCKTNPIQTQFQNVERLLALEQIAAIITDLE